jgi:osmotically-inducible protein OsmY
MSTATLAALELRSSIPETIQAAVHDGHVTLTGTARWLFQKQDAERVVHDIRGVRGVQNHVTITSDSVTKDVRHRIVEALHRQASVDAQHILVTVSADTALLAGTVASWPQREAAEDAAAQAPGIGRVDNRIAVEPREREDELC